MEAGGWRVTPTGTVLRDSAGLRSKDDPAERLRADLDNAAGGAQTQGDAGRSYEAAADGRGSDGPGRSDRGDGAGAPPHDGGGPSSFGATNADELPPTPEVDAVLRNAGLLAVGLGHRELQLDHFMIAMTMTNLGSHGSTVDTELRGQGYDPAKVRKACQHRLADHESARNVSRQTLAVSDQVDRLMRSATKAAAKRPEEQLKFVGLSDVVAAPELADFLQTLSGRFAIRTIDHDEDIDRFSAQLNRMFGHLAGELSSLNDRLAALEAGVGAMSELNGRMEGLEAGVDAAGREIGQLADTVRDVKAHGSALSVSLESISLKIDAANESVSDAVKDVRHKVGATVSEHLDGLEASIGSLSDRLDAKTRRQRKGLF